MIVVNGVIIGKKTFPDGTPMLLDMPHIDAKDDEIVTIKWLYDAGEEFTFYAACLHYAEQGIQLKLVIPYIPNARMDRTKKLTEAHTLRAFAKMLGSIPNIDAIEVWDPHSEEAIRQLEENVGATVDVSVGYRVLFASIWRTLLANNIDCVVFPDVGAKKKYSELFPKYQRVTSAFPYLSDFPQLYGEKVRDWDTGKILGLKMRNDEGEELTEDSIAAAGITSALIVDDICAYGGTIYHCANKLRELGIGKIYAHISHTEDSICNGHLLKSTESPIDGYVTTDDILHVNKMPMDCDASFKVSIALRDGRYKTKDLRFD